MTEEHRAWIYGVEIRKEGDDFAVYVRDLPEVVTAGKTLSEALELAADAIDVIMQMHMEDGDDLPPPSPVRKGEHLVSPPTATAAKANLYRA